MHAHLSRAPMALKVIEKVTPLVTKVMGHNPGPFTLQGSNTYLVGKGREKILIDTGEGKDAYMGSLVEGLDGGHITKILVTHWHPDHVGGLRSVLGHNVAKGAQIYKMEEPSQDPLIWEEQGVDPASVKGIAAGDIFETEGATLRAIHTPGHTKDHICFLLEEEHSLFTGDIVLGQGTTHFSNLTKFMATLRNLLAISKESSSCRVYPAHGPVIEEGTAKIQEYIDHRLLRDKQILAKLRTMAPTTAAAIVADLYSDVPKRLHQAATTNVILHLLNLEAQGLVTAVRKGHTTPFALGGKTTPAELADLFAVVSPNVSAQWSLPPAAQL